MKRLLAVILSQLLVLSLCACSKETQTEQAPTIISVDTLFSDLTNGAKCALNVGKQVTVLGQIETISTDSCQIQLVSHPGQSVLILMPTAILAQLSVERFIAVTGIVESYRGGFTTKYTLRAQQPLDSAAADDVFLEIVAEKFAKGKWENVYDFEEYLYPLYNYMSSNSGRYTISVAEDLRDYLCGTWDCGSFQIYNPNSMSASIFDAFTVTYNSDGSAEYSKHNSWRDDWEVSKYGSLQSFFGDRTVFVLSENVFICRNYVFVRQV